MDREVWVYVDFPASTELVGRLWARVRNGRESATFEYDASWLERSDRYALEPASTLDPAPHHTVQGKALFGALGDSAPDRWGRELMRRASRRAARTAGRNPPTLNEIDYLMMVNDEARLGALRFADEPGGPFLASNDRLPIPPLVDLPVLLDATEHALEEEDETGEYLRVLLAPGSSLGGARPKASVRDTDQQLSIAKFPHRNDEINAVLWEATALTLAERAGIVVPQWRVESVNDRPVLILSRFDRRSGDRILFLSAMSMLGAEDRERRSYLELVDVIRQHGAEPLNDMHALWRRIVFNVLISNTDDHLRNHGFLYVPQMGWALSPAYDMNPVPVDLKPRILSTTIDFDDDTASVELALSVAAYFELEDGAARTIVREVATVVATWRDVARAQGLRSGEIQRMESAFAHDDLTLALGS